MHKPTTNLKFWFSLAKLGSSLLLLLFFLLLPLLNIIIFLPVHLGCLMAGAGYFHPGYIFLEVSIFFFPVKLPTLLVSPNFRLNFGSFSVNIRNLLIYKFYTFLLISCHQLSFHLSLMWQMKRKRYVSLWFCKRKCFKCAFWKCI